MKLEFTSGPLRLTGDLEGDGAPVVGLHGLTATRRYVLMGSRALERGDYRVVLYDARGHGASGAPPDGDYSAAALAADLRAVLDSCGFERAILVGVSMGAHTAVHFALRHPERVAALALVTPGFDPQTAELRLPRWDALSRALRSGGIDGFLSAYDLDALPAAWRARVRTVIEQRLAQHENLDAVADALAAVPRSRPFEDFSELAAITAPTVVVGSRDDADPEHPLATAQRYADALPAAGLLVEDPGHPPLAWQGGQLSRVIAKLSERAHAR
jgi:pimeloyl-ACP methyl ester carboxylesterase